MQNTEIQKKILAGELKTSATIVPEPLQQSFVNHDFTKEAQTKVLIVAGEPRKYSLTYDYIYTAAHFFEKQNCQVMIRDLYDIGFQPILAEDEFYYVKDGLGTAPKALLEEQRWITPADILIFAYPNWHDTPTALIKGYMEKVFAKGFAYTDSAAGPVGLLTGKKMFTIMNCGYLGGGMGDTEDGIGQNDRLWAKYLTAFKVFDDDTAAFWGMENAGRFVCDQHPKNFSATYASELEILRNALRRQLKTKLLD